MEACIYSWNQACPNIGSLKCGNGLANCWLWGKQDWVKLGFWKTSLHFLWEGARLTNCHVCWWRVVYNWKWNQNLAIASSPDKETYEIVTIRRYKSLRVTHFSCRELLSSSHNDIHNKLILSYRPLGNIWNDWGFVDHNSASFDEC